MLSGLTPSAEAVFIKVNQNGKVLLPDGVLYQLERIEEKLDRLALHVSVLERWAQTTRPNNFCPDYQDEDHRCSNPDCPGCE